MLVDAGRRAAPTTAAAEVRVETVLGTKYVAPDRRRATGSDLLEDGDTITDTHRDAGRAVRPPGHRHPAVRRERRRGRSTTCSTASPRSPRASGCEVEQIIDGLNQVTGAITEREDEARRLLDSAADPHRHPGRPRRGAGRRHRQPQRGRLAAWQSRRADLVDLLVQTAEAAGQTADLVGRQPGRSSTPSSTRSTRRWRRSASHQRRPRRRRQPTSASPSRASPPSATGPEEPARSSGATSSPSSSAPPGPTASSAPACRSTGCSTSPSAPTRCRSEPQRPRRLRGARRHLPRHGQRLLPGAEWRRRPHRGRAGDAGLALAPGTTA